jgi:Bacterial SH3 domain
MKLLTSLLLLSVPVVNWVSLPNSVFAQPPASLQMAYAPYATLTSHNSSSPINVRDGASVNAYARHIGYAGDRVEILDRLVGNDGYMWFQVRFLVSNATGWIRGDYILADEEPYYN